MYLNKASVRLVILVISIPLVVLGTIAKVVGQAPPNLPPPGAYQPIPNFTGVGAGLLFRGAINDRFSGVQRMAPAIATASFANLPVEQDGMLIYCVDCKLTSPCAGIGTGAWALGARGHWSCSNGVLEANLNANGNKLTNLTNGTVGGDTLVFGQPAGSDLSGSFPNPIVQTVLGGKTPVYSNQSNPILNDSVLPVIGVATKVQVNGGANITLNKPSTVVPGHTMVMGYFSQNSAAPTPPSGWTLIRSDTCGGAMGSYYKVAGSSEPSSYTWTLGSSYSAAALIDVGVTAANPVDVISPAVCGGTPALSGLSISGQPENVIMFGAGVNGNVSQVGFSQGTLATLQPALGGVPFSSADLTANYPITPTINLSGSGANETGQMIAIKPASGSSSSPVLQGDTYAELTNLVPTAGSTNASIGGFNIDGRFNVKNPFYGAKGNGLNDDTAAIQAAYNAACAAALATGRSQTLWFPAGVYLTSFSIISNCGATNGVISKGEGEGTSVIQAGGIYPVIMHEGGGYLAGITGNGAITAASLATGSGSSLNWGVSSQQYYDLKDAQVGSGATGWSNAQPINGASALSVEGYFNYAGGASGPIYILESNGDDLGLASNAIQIYLNTSTGHLGACLTTSVSGFQCISGPTGSVSSGTTYEFEASYDGSDLRLFYGIPGGTTTLVGTLGMTGTVVQKPSEAFALGDGGSGLLMTGEQLQASNHWVGQLDSIRISNTARHTATYTAPTAKFTNDGNTMVLLNNLAQSDVLLQVTNVAGLGSSAPVWIPIHAYGVSGLGTNTHASFVNLSLSGGNYNLLGIGTVYTTLDHIAGGGASHDGIKFWNNSYGTRIEHLTVAGTPYSESGLTMSYNSGLVDLQWLFQTGSYYGMEMVDAGGVYSMLFLNPGTNQVAGIDAAATSLFHSYSIHEIATDFESGGTQTPVKIWGVGTYEFYGGDFQDGNNNAIQVAPTGGGQALGLSLFGGNVVTGSSPAALIGWKGSNSPLTPATWINPVVNDKTLTGSGVPLSSNPAYAQAMSDVLIPPVKTVATLPSCSAAATGWVVQVSDCSSNCSTYLGTTFTGGGSTRVTVQCNGTAWELH